MLTFWYLSNNNTKSKNWCRKHISIYMFTSSLVLVVYFFTHNDKKKLWQFYCLLNKDFLNFDLFRCPVILDIGLPEISTLMKSAGLHSKALYCMKLIPDRKQREDKIRVSCCLFFFYFICSITDVQYKSRDSNFCILKIFLNWENWFLYQQTVIKMIVIMKVL